MKVRVGIKAYKEIGSNTVSERSLGTSPTGVRVLNNTNLGFCGCVVAQSDDWLVRADADSGPSLGLGSAKSDW
jgi:hypothetical protein